jgi:hypothetical protein
MRAMCSITRADLDWARSDRCELAAGERVGAKDCGAHAVQQLIGGRAVTIIPAIRRYSSFGRLSVLISSRVLGSRITGLLQIAVDA